MQICRGCYHFTGSELTEMGHCGKHGISIHESTNMEGVCYVQRELREKQAEELTDEPEVSIP